MTNISPQGHCDAQYLPLLDEFQRRLNSGDEHGASLAVVQDGELIVDLWGGYADEQRSQMWLFNTLVECWSLTKTMTALSALLLVERGQLDIQAPVAKYWPEFATNGKPTVLVKHILSHSSGLAGWEQPIDIADICHVQKAAAALAVQAPWWEPGSASGYHVLTYGHLVGELIHRVTGSTLQAFFREEIAAPLNADFHIGVDPADIGRIATTIAPAIPPIPPEGGIAHRALTQPALVPEFANSTPWRTAGLGAAGGYGNARSLAKVQSVISNQGHCNGKQLLSPASIELATQSTIRSVDLVLGAEIDFGLGYGLARSGLVPFIPSRNICFWAGAGGSLLINDLDTRSTFAYVMNKMEPGAILGGPNSIACYNLFNSLQSSAR